MGNREYTEWHWGEGWSRSGARKGSVVSRLGWQAGGSESG